MLFNPIWCVMQIGLFWQHKNNSPYRAKPLICPKKCELLKTVLSSFVYFQVMGVSGQFLQKFLQFFYQISYYTTMNIDADNYYAIIHHKLILKQTFINRFDVSRWRSDITRYPVLHFPWASVELESASCMDDASVLLFNHLIAQTYMSVHNNIYLVLLEIRCIYKNLNSSLTQQLPDGGPQKRLLEQANVALRHRFRCAMTELYVSASCKMVRHEMCSYI